MKNILIIGAGVMGSAFTIPCTDNRNNVINDVDLVEMVNIILS